MFIPTIGLEIHIELNTQSKMFCGCRNNSDETSPNVNVCPICLAHPGTLPVINQKAVKKVVKTGLALNCFILQESFFERKNYFYPDLPKGYQISQYQAPLAKDGSLELASGKKIRIERLHLEEDTGRLLHQENDGSSLVDFNRAGVPLMELVTEPDIGSAQEAREFVKELQLVLRYLKVSEANMEKGEMRCEVNISLKEKEADGLGTKVEVKNLNSARSVEKAIEYEINRQKEVLEKGKKVVQETRGWHDAKQITFSQRSKEESHDYRYFKEPDLPPLALSDEFVAEIKKEIPETPQAKRQRFKNEYGFSDKELELYIAQRDLGEYLEKVVSELQEWVSAKMPKIDLEGAEFKRLIKLTSNYIATDLQAMLKGRDFEETKFPITAENFAEFISMLFTKEISSKIAKTVLKEMFEKGSDPSQIIEEKGLKQITNNQEVEKIAQQTIDENPKIAADFRGGKIEALQALVGSSMKICQGKADPQKIRVILNEKLKEK